MISRKVMTVCAVTGLEGGCIAAILWLGGVWLRIEPSVCGEDAGPTCAVEASSAAASASAGDCASGDDDSPGPRTVAGPLGDADRRPIAVAADRDEPARARRARTGEHAGESDLYAAFMASASSGTGELERGARQTLSGAGPRYAKVAALRALWDARSPEAAAMFADAIAREPDVSDVHSESLPRFALGWLARCAPRSDTARRVLEDVAWPRDRAAARAALDLRRVAAASFAASASESELARIGAHLQGETDREWIDSVASGLARNPNTRTAEAILWSLGVDPQAHRNVHLDEE
jgi:hypothetical protein